MLKNFSYQWHVDCRATLFNAAELLQSSIQRTTTMPSNKSKNTPQAPTAATAATTAGTTPQRDHAPLENELLKRLYAEMLRCRLVLESAAAQARASRSRLRPAIGREAIEVGCVIEFEADDVALCPETSVAAPLVLGSPVDSIVAQFAKRTPLTPATQIVSLPGSADALAVAAGIGYGFRQLKKSNVVFALDAGTAPPHARDAFALVARDRLPVVAVLENLGKDSHPARLVEAGRKHGVPCITVDANDAVAVYRVAREAIHRARTGRGGTIIDCYPLPLPGNRPTDGLAAMEQYMKRFGIWSDDWKEELRMRFGADLKQRSRPAK